MYNAIFGMSLLKKDILEYQNVCKKITYVNKDSVRRDVCAVLDTGGT